MLVPEITIVLNRQDIAALKAEILRGMAAAGPEALLHLGQKARDTLAHMHEGAGHQRVAASWQVGKLEPTGDGWRIEVFSALEGQTLYSQPTHPSSPHAGEAETPWAFAGRDLLAWLEYGVGQHPITAREPGHKLIWKGSAEEGDDGGLHSVDRSQDFLGSAYEEKGITTFRLVGSAEDYKAVAREVLHPGYPGFHFMEATQVIMEHFAREEAFHAAGKVASRIN